MTNGLSPLEQSLVEDIAADEQSRNPQPEEANANEVADKVTEQLDEIPHGELEKEATEEGEEQKPEEVGGEEEALPANPTNNDFAKLRLQLKKEREEKEKALLEAARKDGFIEATKQMPKAETQQQAPQDPEPDFNEDPKAWVQWKDRQTENRIAAVEQKYQMQQVKEQVRGVIDEAKRAEEVYAKDNPDYSPAKQFLKDIVVKDLKAANPLKTDKEIEAMVLQEEYAANIAAKQLGFSAPIYMEMLAKQAGYKPQPKTEVQKEPEAPAKIEKKPNFEAMQRNKSKTVSLVGTRSNAGSMGEPTDEEVADMTLSQMAGM
jgi:hypothetical protein